MHIDTATSSRSSKVVGELSELWRYPVKSMLGERCERLDIDPRGVVGDRRYAVRNAEGKLGSGKNTRRFCKLDGLFGFRARLDGAMPVIEFPNGDIRRGDDPDVHQALSAAFGQPVTLAAEGEVSHLDAAPLHLLSSASLAWLRTALPEAGVDARRFRPNFVIDAAGAEHVERSWVGKRLRIGSEVVLRPIENTVRCAMVTFAQSELPGAPQILRHLAGEADAEFGIYAQVLVPGTVRRGDPVVLID